MAATPQPRREQLLLSVLVIGRSTVCASQVRGGSLRVTPTCRLECLPHLCKEHRIGCMGDLTGQFRQSPSRLRMALYKSTRRGET
jgi:hypothetical protein